MRRVVLVMVAVAGYSAEANSHEDPFHPASGDLDAGDGGDASEVAPADVAVEASADAPTPDAPGVDTDR